MQRVSLVFRRSFSTLKDSKAYQAAKEFLTIHESYVPHTRVVPEGSTTPGYRYPAPGSNSGTPVIPTTTDTDRYFRNDLVQHDTRYLEREVHVMLSPSMKSLPKDIQMDYIKEYSLAGDNTKILEHPTVEMKASDLNLWATETDEKVQENLYKDYPDQLPHPFWENDAGKIVEEYESKGLPPCPGKMYQWECPKEMESGLW